MTIKRLLLILSTLVAIGLATLSLANSWQKPQFQSRLELYQTNISLQAQAWEPEDGGDGNFSAMPKIILEDQPLSKATKQYEEAQKSVQSGLGRVKTEIAQLVAESKSPTVPKPLEDIFPQLKLQELQQSLNQQQKLLAELDLRLGILQAQQEQQDTAIKTWSELQQPVETLNPEFQDTAAVLSGIWSNPPRILPNAQQLIQKNLDGWFRSTALIHLYQLQQRQEALSKVKAAQQEAAAQAVFKLTLLGTIPALAALIGTILIIFLFAQRLFKGRESLLGQNADLPWTTPWDGETIVQVFVLGFFFMGQLLVPSILSQLRLDRFIINVQFQALYVLVSYILVASGALSVLYFSIKPFFPLPTSWFRCGLGDNNWWWWGLGGYCTALPVVVVVSLINQKFWQGQGGSNMLLQLVLESQNVVALVIFFTTAAIAAPLFEEILFRGFLLPSLTRYIPVWGAILLSGLLFAIAHLSLSEVLPLTALGIVLGIVYTRSRNLLAPMLLHSLWNSGTLLSLFLLGNSN